MTFRTYVADEPRFVSASNRLLIEGQRTNGFTNPRCEGAVAGTPGTMPTFWTIAASLGLAVNVVGVGSEDGLPFVDIQFVGTPTSTGNVQVTPGGTPAAADGQVWTLSMFTRLVGGSLTNVGSAIMALQVGTGSANPTYTLSSARLSETRQSATATGAGGATISTGRWRCGVTSGLAVDFTVRFAGVQNEQGPFASTPIFPAVGSPAASTRGTDLLSATLASLGIPDSGVCTVLFSGMIPQAAPAATNFNLFQMDNGGADNRIVVLNSQNGSAINLLPRLGGVGTAAGMGSITPGVPFRCGMSVFGDGTAIASLNGATPVTATGLPTSGLLNFRIGTRNGGLDAMFGEVRDVRIMRAAVSGAVLQSLVLGMPT